MAKKTGLTVKWTSTRTEDLLESAQGRDQYCDIELACDSNGKMVALRANIVADAGVAGTLKGQAILSSMLLPGSYKIPNIDIQARAYVTNKTPSGPVRGAGRPDAGFYVERIVDEMARELKMDPVEFRRRNAILPSEFPYNNGVGFVYDSADFPGLLDTLIKASKYDELQEWKHKVNRSRGSELAGVGICLEIEDTGTQLTESAHVVAFAKDGSVTIFTGSSPHGQGHETTLALIVSRELGITTEKVRVVWGDTSLVQSGIGTFGSRSAATGGSSALEATRKVKELILARASQLIGRAPAELRFRDGSLIVEERGGTQTVMSFSELMKKIGTDLEAASDFKLPSPTFSSGAHLCALTVDSETGKVSIKKYIAIDDAGTVISQAIVDGQIHGGVVHGIGGALLEELVYDEDGQPQSSNFLSYTIPTSLDAPDVETAHFETPSTIALNGARGVGESGTTAAYPAVFNALNDALRQLPSAGEINIAPATPEVVYRAVHKVLKP
jgi:aerobic carbon-monoxide dehydrogenase large subunit